jgi:hypothetical protein
LDASDDVEGESLSVDGEGGMSAAALRVLELREEREQKGFDAPEHEQVLIEWEGTAADVDVNIAPLVLACWKLGLRTASSCWRWISPSHLEIQARFQCPSREGREALVYRPRMIRLRSASKAASWARRRSVSSARSCDEVARRQRL